MPASHRVAAIALVALTLAGCGVNQVSAPVVSTPLPETPADPPAGAVREYVIAMAASGPAVVASLSMGLARTTDHGDTWTVVHTMPAHNFAGDGSALFAATPKGVLRSLDHGATWNFLSGGIPPGRSVRSVAFRGGTLFAALPLESGLYRSTDLGESWTKCELPGGGNAIVVFARDQDLFVNAMDRHVYRSTDDGQSWAVADDGLPAERWMLFGASAGRLFAGTWIPLSLYASTDDGASWTRSDAGLPTDRNLAALSAHGSGLFVSSAGGLFRSTDGGAAWLRLPVGAPAAPQVSAFVEQAGVLFAGTSGDGIFRSPDNGATWVKVSPTGLPPEPVFTLDD